MPRIQPSFPLIDLIEGPRDDSACEIAKLRREVALLRTANAELERVIVRDTLTPLYNRRYFVSALGERIGRAARYGASAIAMIVDVDRMKHINDAHGHLAGDFVLVRLAGILQGSIRSSDVAARIGGDEFALILDQMDLANGELKAAFLAQRVSQADWRFGEVALDVSSTFGFAAIEAQDSDNSIILRADQAMYAHKRMRRRLA